jgi:hypothetical protein
VGDDKFVWFGTDIIPRDGGFSRRFVISGIYIWLNILSPWVPGLIRELRVRALIGRTAGTILGRKHRQLLVLGADSVQVNISLVPEPLIP